MKQIVSVKVTEVQDNYVRCYIPEFDRMGRIRKKEYVWDQSVRANIPTFQEGEICEAVVISLKSLSGDVILSIRELTNPWEYIEKVKLLAKDKVIRGEIIGVRNFAAFAQVYPGIIAIIYPQDIPTRLPLSEVLYRGDQVIGLVSEYVPSKRRLRISLIDYLSQAASKNLSLAEILTEDHTEIQSHASSFLDTTEILPHEMKPPPEEIVVIDDKPERLLDIAVGLEELIGIDVVPYETVESLRQSVQHAQIASNSLLIIDMELENGYSGIDLGNELQNIATKNGQLVDILIMSDNPMPPPDNPFDFVTKFVKNIELHLTQHYDLRSGEKPVLRSVKFTDTDVFLQQLGMAVYSRDSLKDSLTALMHQTLEQNHFSHVFVLEVDQLLGKAIIVANVPDVDTYVFDQLAIGLYHSPVKEVIEEGIPIYEKFVDVEGEQSKKRFQNFFSLMRYQAYIGIPFNLKDFRRRYCIFFLDEYRPDFEDNEYEATVRAAPYFEIALQRYLMIDYMRRYEQRYSEGLLLGALVHELRNRLDGVAGSIKAIRTEYPHVSHDSLHDLDGHVFDFENLIEAYSSLMQTVFKDVSINDVILKIHSRFDKRESIVDDQEKVQTSVSAMPLDIDINVDLASEGSTFYGVETHLEQILFNVVLNAVQQIETHQKDLALYQSNTQHFLIRKKIRIEARWQPDDNYPLQISVLDTGPGIHFHKWSDIFLLDISTREEGHGLGLFISQTLAYWMGGRIRVADSVMFVGSMFTIEFSVKNPERLTDNSND